MTRRTAIGAIGLCALGLLGCSDGRSTTARDGGTPQEDASTATVPDAGSDGGCSAPGPCRGDWECGTAVDACGETRSCGSCGDQRSCRDHACLSSCDGCVLAGSCYFEGETDPGNACSECRAGEFGEREAGSACDDGDECTSDDRCSAGRCAGTPEPCADDVACNGDERCDPQTGECVLGENTCAGSLCDVASDVCTEQCDGCAIDSVCYPDGARRPGNPCLQCEVARSTSAWSADVNAACGQGGSECRSAGVCDEQGTCVEEPAASGTACGSGDTACAAWSCDGDGACLVSNVDEGTPCSEPDDPCELPDECDGQGACLAGGELAVGAACIANAHCAGADGERACVCDQGFVADGDVCVNVDECTLDSDDCDDAPDACVDEPGGFHCACPAEFSGDGEGVSGCQCARDDYSPLCRPYGHVSMQWLHACAISDGALYCWGANDDGQLGTGDRDDRALPVRVGDARDWTAVSVGFLHTCGVRAGAMYCWGSPDLGALGHGGSGLLPERVGTASDWTAVATGILVSCGIRAGGALYCWGRNGHGVVGIGSTELAFSTPQRVTALDAVQAVSLNGSTACALRSGELYCWGDNTIGLVGNGTIGGDVTTPFHVTGFNDWIRVGVGCGLREGGALYCWGAARSGSGPSVPTVVPGRSDWAMSSGTAVGGCGVTLGGDGYCWGANDRGQVGDDASTLPVADPFLLMADEPWQMFAGGQGATCGLRDGGLYCWGSNERGLRGSGFSKGRVGSASNWLSVTTSPFSHSCGIRAPGELYCWGWLPAVVDAPRTRDPRRIGSDSDWTEVSAGTLHTCGIRGGELYCWGLGDQGRLGNGSATDQPDPVRVGTAGDWIRVTVGDHHSCGVRAGGTLYCWGDNQWGQLGDDSTTDRPTPVPVAGTGWSRISAARDHTCGLRGGELYCWGGRYSGQLGDGGNSGTQNTPLRIGTSTTWSTVSAGDSHTCGVDAGVLHCWGSNIYGATGLGTTFGATLVPTLVSSDPSWSQVSAGRASSCAVSVDGELYCWGDNDHGQLGTGDSAARLAPARADSASGWHAASVQYNRTCAIRSGALYCWGTNEFAALGHGEGFAPAPIGNGNDLR